MNVLMTVIFYLLFMKMADPTRPKSDILDSEGLEYHHWVFNVETDFVVKEYSATVETPKDPTDKGPSNKVPANALKFIR